MKRRLLSLMFLTVLGLGILLAQNWKVMPEYSIAFDGSGAEGTFDEFTAEIEFDPQSVAESAFKVEINAASINTGNKTQDKHARGDSWFDVENYPTITFVSTEVVKKEGMNYQMNGVLNMHGVKKSISFPFTFEKNNEGGVFNGSFTIDRTEFEIKGPMMAFMVGDEFQVNVRVPVK